MYHWKGNLTASRTHSKNWKTVLIGCPKKFQTYKIWIYCIYLWSTRSEDFEYIITFAKNLSFAKIWAKTDFATFFKVFIKSRNLNISRKQSYIRNLQTNCFKAMYNMFRFLSLKFGSTFVYSGHLKLRLQNCAISKVLFQLISLERNCTRRD